MPFDPDQSTISGLGEVEGRYNGESGTVQDAEDELEQSVHHTAEGCTGSPPTETSDISVLGESPQQPFHGRSNSDEVLDDSSPGALDQHANLPHPNQARTDSKFHKAGNQAQAPPLRSMATNQYGTQPNSRQTPRLQNTQKSGLGTGNAGAGWAFGAPTSGNAFGGLVGGAPGLGQVRPQQLSGFAQVMGGGSGQAPIDMRYVM